MLNLAACIYEWTLYNIFILNKFHNDKKNYSVLNITIASNNDIYADIS